MMTIHQLAREELNRSSQALLKLLDCKDSNQCKTCSPTQATLCQEQIHRLTSKISKFMTIV